MAVNKVINTKATSHGALRNTLEYALRDEKTEDDYVEITGPYTAQTINYEDVYREWINEKQLWDKDSGRMYAHNVISFHKDEEVTPQEVLDISKEFAERFFSGYQSLISVHQDRDHLHCHIVTNSVSYIDGIKLHQTKRDLQAQKDFTNRICKDRGLSVTKKGYHFDATLMKDGHLNAWSKDKYTFIRNSTAKSYVAECAMALIDVVPNVTNREDFITAMKSKGWDVQWTDNSKHIVFQNEQGQKVRDSNIEKTYSMALSKEYLLEVFEYNKNLNVFPGFKDKYTATTNSHSVTGQPHQRVSIKKKISEKNKLLESFNQRYTKLVDLSQEKIAQSIGYTNWAIKENLKRAASIYAELGRSGLQSESKRNTRIQELTEQADQEKCILQNLDKELNSLRSIIYYANIYNETQEDPEDSNNEHNQHNDRYHKEYEHRLRLFENARDKLKTDGVDPSTLNINELLARYNKLLSEKTELNASCLSHEKEAKDLKDMCESLNKFLNDPGYTHAQLFISKSKGLSLER